MSTPTHFRLHHVGYVTGEIESVTNAYVSRFGYERSTGIIHDPAQTARVQFLKIPGEHTYLEFVAPDSPASKLSAQAKRGGLNHLCYLVGSMEEAIVTLENTDMKLISDPKPAIAFAGRRICWLFGPDQLPIELVERRDADDLCVPGLHYTQSL
jgi:methylmalonyl-CoA/ethylmalonyl-CoA epimerase